MQGAAEVVPVSSSAQLTLLPWLLGWDEPADRTTFAAALHAGSCAGMTWALRADLALLSRSDLAWLSVTSVPAAVAGLVLSDQAEQRFGGRARLASLLAGAGVLLWVADRRPEDRSLDRVAMAAAGLAQVAALVPGVSRSGAALTALRALRVGRTDAQRHTALMSLPITAGAAVLTVARADRLSVRSMAKPLATGVPCAAVTAAIGTAALQRHGRAPVTASALYRLAVATAVVVRQRRTGPL